MKYWIGFVCLILAYFPVKGQQKMHVRVTQVPLNHPNEPIYLSGNFNQWQPADPAYVLQEVEKGVWEIIVDLMDVPSDRVEYKFTRGNWQKSECSALGHLETPRTAPLDKDIEVTCQIAGWRDFFPASTASPQVQLLDSAFYMPSLGRHRPVWIYLPKDYASSQKHYPVLYLHDGQHVFDEKTSKGRIGPIEWGVDEILDQSAYPCIVVAINHQDSYEDRYPEYLLHPNADYDKAEGEDYLKFLVHTLKPYIDKHYRTLKGPAHTGLAGSSMGGLITFYAGIRYPKVFGLLGVFSPSIWLDHGHLEKDLLALKKSKAISRQQYYFYAGKEENRRKPDGTFVQMSVDVERAAKLLEPHIKAGTHISINPHGRHGALYWREAFPAFYAWFALQTGLTQ